MTKPLQQVSRRCAGFPLSAILVGPHRCDRKPGLTLSNRRVIHGLVKRSGDQATGEPGRSEEHTSELQSLRQLLCRLLLEKKTPIPGTALTIGLHDSVSSVDIMGLR